MACNRFPSLGSLFRYFLGAQNWAVLNTGPYTCFPFERFVGSDPEEGDQGFDLPHDISEYHDDCCLSVIKVIYLVSTLFPANPLDEHSDTITTRGSSVGKTRRRKMGSICSMGV